ncbi:MAG TPA: CDP-diacylglycerol--glycerol-3-phosphate 3-phosphatidyltransferase [Gammaproteobacteria bacterium]|nr:CDP-diacylglycerol--glycerol-3-phosphate 3-phosphatidyltransferase [Gammaproteobacteria bacterium]
MKPINIPNLLTLIRILLIPLIVFIFYLPIQHAGMISAILFAVAGITDWFDGYLARRLNQTSSLGAFLDPVADKLMVAVVLVMVVERFGSLWIALPAMIIIGREITISALREWMAQVGSSAKVKVSYLGKVKTTVQMFALFFLLYEEPLPLVGDFNRLFSGTTLGILLLVVAAVLTFWSMLNYIQSAISE